MHREIIGKKCEQIAFIIFPKFKLKITNPNNTYASLTNHRLFHPCYVSTRDDIDEISGEEVKSIDPFYLKAAHITLQSE